MKSGARRKPPELQTEDEREKAELGVLQSVRAHAGVRGHLQYYRSGQPAALGQNKTPNKRASPSMYERTIPGM